MLAHDKILVPGRTLFKQLYSEYSCRFTYLLVHVHMLIKVIQLSSSWEEMRVNLCSWFMRLTTRNYWFNELLKIIIAVYVLN